MQVGRATTLNITLQIGLTESLVVTGETPLVDLSSKEIGGHVSSDELVDTLSFNRNFTSYLGLLPGSWPASPPRRLAPTPSTSTGSRCATSTTCSTARTTTTRSTAETAARRPGCRSSRCRSSSSSPASSTPSTARTSGGVVNAVSKQGTNRLRGSVFTFFQNASDGHRDYFAVQNDLEKAADQAAAVRRHARRPHRQGQGPLLLQPGADQPGPGRHGVRPRPARDQSHRLRGNSGLEPPGPFRPPVEPEQHLGRAAASGRPPHRPTSSTPTRGRAGREKETDTDWTFVTNVNSVLGSTRSTPCGCRS